ncbi:MAG: hypothetical protein Q7T56_05965 [Nocardioidaceae bacterium]|nr:hypothetical protein [Nocardioidaceae bacterium]
MDLSGWVLAEGDHVAVGGRLHAGLLAPTADPLLGRSEPFVDLAVPVRPAPATDGTVTVTGTWRDSGVDAVSVGPLAGASGFSLAVGTGVRVVARDQGPPKQRDVDHVLAVLDAEQAGCGLAMTGERPGADGRPRVVAWVRQVTPALAARLVDCHPTVLVLDVWIRPGAAPAA